MKNLILAVIAFFALAGCTAMTGESAGRNIDDTSITSSVKAKLAADNVASLTRVDVDTNNAVVSLNGIVQSSDQKARAQQLASEVGGVRRVVNNLQVQTQ